MNTIKNTVQKGFTLIELLIVIAVLGVLAAIVVAAIDPVDKINAANDAKVRADIATIATGLESYAVQNNGAYPAALADMTTSTQGQLKSVPVGPGGTAYTYAVSTAPNYYVGFALKSKKAISESLPAGSGTTANYRYDTSNGKTCLQDNMATACP